MEIKTTLDTGEKVLVLQDPDKLTADHMLHTLTDTTRDKDGSVTRCERGVSSGIENEYYNCFSPREGKHVFSMYSCT